MYPVSLSIMPPQPRFGAGTGSFFDSLLGGKGFSQEVFHHIADAPIGNVDFKVGDSVYPTYITQDHELVRLKADSLSLEQINKIKNEGYEEPTRITIGTDIYYAFQKKPPPEVNRHFWETNKP